MNTLLQSCTILPGIGSQTLEKIQNLGVHRIYDLLLHLPFRYQDRTRITAIADLRIQQAAVVQGIITESHWLPGKRRIYHCKIQDKTGELNLRFFNMPSFLQKKLYLNQSIKACAEVKLKSYGFEMLHPEIEFDNTSVQEYFTPYYPSTHGLSQNQWRKYIKICFQDYADVLHNLEYLSIDFLRAHGLVDLNQALHQLHFPSPDQDADQLSLSLHPARKRLALEELIAFSLSSQEIKRENKQHQANAYPLATELEQKLLKSLSFELTDGQKNVLQEIQADLKQTIPMLRLLQGDVGAGKTIVCALAALGPLAQKHQVALMAPTDLLSEQHYQTLKTWLNPLGFKIQRLNRSCTAKEKKTCLTQLAEGEIDFVIGTHALFQDKVAFKQLGLVIIDEQHRFGVLQRLKLAEKTKNDYYPHQLFVTATPIPRTLAMTQFSHFDLSILNQLPKGRKPIQTAVMADNKRDLIIQRIKENLKQKGQVYWVCTRIEEDEEVSQQATAAIQAYLKQQLADARITMVHGQLKSVEKEASMRAFKNGEFDILVATTVIEVGVDVPNANIMIIENAEKLGLSQLHQLRGRVGRGQQESFCILLYTPPLSLVGQQRLQAIRQSNDGFWLAEEDMKIRGYGAVLGTQQSGFNEFRIAKMPDHYELLKLALQLAPQILAKHPALAKQLLRTWYHEAHRFLQA